MYVIVATPSIKLWMKNNLSRFIVSPSSKHILQQYYSKTDTGEDFLIKLYASNTLTIEGSLKKRVYTSLINNSINKPEIGCDEVGVGDFFGPVVYAAVRLDNDSINKVANLFVSIKDSKKFNDAEIMLIYAKIKDVIDYNVKVIYDKDIINNMNSVEQKVYYHLTNINSSDELVIIDLFTTLNAFYKYQRQFNLELPKDLILETKADSKFLSVALASIIARAVFLIEMGKLNEKYHFEFPKGSSDKNLDKIIDNFIEKNSIEELKLIAKTSFSTYKRAEERWK